MKGGKIDALQYLAENDADLVKQVESALEQKSTIQTKVKEIMEQLSGVLEGSAKRKIAKSIGELRKIVGQLIIDDDLAEAPGHPRLPTPPHLTSEMAKAFLDACGGKLNSKDTVARQIKVDGIVFEDMPSRILPRVSRAVFKKNRAITLSARYLMRLASGLSHQEAIINIDENQHAPMPAPPQLTPKLALAFMKALDYKLSPTDRKRYSFKFEDIVYQDSPSVFLQRIGRTVFGNQNSIRKAGLYIKFLIKTKSHKIALKNVEMECDAIPLPLPPELTSKIATKFFACCGKLNTEDSERQSFIFDGCKYDDCQRNFYARVAQHVFGNRNLRAGALKFVRSIAEGNSYEEAKKLAGLGTIRITYWKDQVNICKTREDFLALFTLNQISEEIWRHAGKLLTGQALLSSAIKNRFPHKHFIACMDDQLPFNEFKTKEEALEYLNKEILRLRATGKWIRDSEISGTITREEYIEISKLEYYYSNIVVKVITDYLDPRTKQ